MAWNLRCHSALATVSDAAAGTFSHPTLKLLSISSPPVTTPELPPLATGSSAAVDNGRQLRGRQRGVGRGGHTALETGSSCWTSTGGEEARGQEGKKLSSAMAVAAVRRPSESRP